MFCGAERRQIWERKITTPPEKILYRYFTNRICRVVRCKFFLFFCIFPCRCVEVSRTKFFRFGFWAEGQGVNAQKPKHILQLLLMLVIIEIL